MSRIENDMRISNNEITEESAISRKKWQLNTLIFKQLATCILAAVLVIGTAIPAFATDVTSSEGSGTATESTDTASGDGGSSSEPSAPEPSSSNGMINETVTLLPPDSSNAASSSAGESSNETPAPEEDATDIPEDNELCSWTTDGRTWSTMRGGSAMTVTNAQAFGIDVSQWQGEIDWARAKAAGVQFAIIRCGYGTAERGDIDTQFLANVNGCRENGIPFGIYLYAIARDASEATAEANRTLELLNAAGITPDELKYPVYYDMESDNQKATDATTRGDMAENFCYTLSEAGFTPGIYASHYWFANLLTDARFDNWTRWAASYPGEGEEGATSSYSGPHDMWQCMSRGVVDGIEGRVDIDFDYHFVEAEYSDVYNYEAYVANNPDVAEVYADDPHGAFLHFINSGMDEGRISSDTFNLHGYYNSNPDLRAAFGFDFRKYFEHYMTSGVKEGRSCAETRVPVGLVKGTQMRDLSSIYDPYAYLVNNPDLEAIYTREAYGKTYLDDSGLFKHFLTEGYDAGLSAK